MIIALKSVIEIERNCINDTGFEKTEKTHRTDKDCRFQLIVIRPIINY